MASSDKKHATRVVRFESVEDPATDVLFGITATPNPTSLQPRKLGLVNPYNRNPPAGEYRADEHLDENHEDVDEPFFNNLWSHANLPCQDQTSRAYWRIKVLQFTSFLILSYL